MDIKEGYLFMKKSCSEDGIVSSDVIIKIDTPHITWTDLLEEFRNFVLACGYRPPEGELVWLEKDEVIVTKDELELLQECND